jgi:hypothetical protein
MRGNAHKTASAGFAWAKHYLAEAPPPHARTIPSPPLTTRVLFLSDSAEGRRNYFPHVAMCLRIKCRLGGRNVVPVGVWPTLMLRGVSQPTPNAPKAPRAIGMCLNIASGHVRRCFDISEVLDVQRPPIFATQVRIWARLVVHQSSYHMLGECRP